MARTNKTRRPKTAKRDWRKKDTQSHIKKLRLKREARKEGESNER